MAVKADACPAPPDWYDASKLNHLSMIRDEEEGQSSIKAPGRAPRAAASSVPAERCETRPGRAYGQLPLRARPLTASYIAVVAELAPVASWDISHAITPPAFERA